MRILYLFKEHFKCEKSEITKYYESAECKLFFPFFWRYLFLPTLCTIVCDPSSFFSRWRVCSSDSVAEFVLQTVLESLFLRWPEWCPQPLGELLTSLEVMFGSTECSSLSSLATVIVSKGPRPSLCWRQSWRDHNCQYLLSWAFTLNK